jgi:uncharacterized membrane protein
MDQPESSHQHADLHRLIVLSDAVFAIAMTLLALELHPPAAWDGQIASLFQAMHTALVAYVVSFLMIGAYWMAHCATFRHLVRADRPLCLLTITSLGLVTLLPVTTRLMIERGHEAHGALIVYLGLIASIGLMNALVWGYAALRPSMMIGDVAPRRRIVHFAALLVTPVAACIVSYLSFAVHNSIAWWALVAGVVVLALVRKLRSRKAMPAQAPTKATASSPAPARRRARRTS